MNLVDHAMNYAVAAHKRVNQTYNRHDYDFHLTMVVGYAKKFIHLVHEIDRDNVLAACWCHDLIEDARETYNDVKTVTNETVAEIVYALTNEKGRTRAERANDKYYQGIRETPHAPFAKLCDRLANVKYSRNAESRMLFRYREEHEHFISQLYLPEHQQMWLELESLYVPKS